MIEVMYDIASGSTYKFNSATMGEQVRMIGSLPLPYGNTEYVPRSLLFLTCSAV